MDCARAAYEFSDFFIGGEVFLRAGMQLWG
jgi:hypothetical protein